MKIKGLSTTQVENRLKKYGRNEIKKGKGINPFKIFISQFTSPLILILVGAGVFSLLIEYFEHGNYFDSILILIIVLITGISGFVQDYKAEKAIEALQKISIPKIAVIRNGIEQEIETITLVPDDIVILSSGNVVPADIEIIEGEIEVDESILTGESMSVYKKTKDKIFSGCGVLTGNSVGVVVATGMDTEIGKIAAKMEEIKEEETVFQKHIKKFSNKLITFIVVLIIITFAISLFKFDVWESILISIALAVAAIPEGLTAIVTLALSLGAKNMVKHKALVRKLAIVESIGDIDIICTDKTGTLTEGNMKVKSLWQIIESREMKVQAVLCSLLCNDAKQIEEEGAKKWLGDETDVAIKHYAIGEQDEEIEKIKKEVIKKVPFSSEKKMMSVECKIEGKNKVYYKGALEVLLPKCVSYLDDKKVRKMKKKVEENILKINNEYAGQGIRVIMLARADSKSENDDNLIFLGLILLADPIREKTRESVEECAKAGIRTIMMTGDNPLTAKSIAEKAGIHTKEVIIGSELDEMSENDLNEALKKGCNVFARTSPFHKLQILKLLQEQGNIVAMTGDGVNDALALKKADIGIAMGIRGTEVSKEASDIILLDDDFSTIKDAVREGRRIFDNIKKFIDYLLTCNVAEVIVVLFSTLFFPFVVMYPIQILWINLITDGMTALALAVDPARTNIMDKRPNRNKEGIVDKKTSMLVYLIGLKKSTVILLTFVIALWIFGLEKARTTVFTGFIVYEFVRIAVIRYNEKLASYKDWFKNKFLLYSLIISFILQVGIIYSPFAEKFKVVPIGWSWLIIFSGAIVGLILGIMISNFVDKKLKV